MAEFKNQFKNFKPEFGNEYHIHILKKMNDYYRVRSTYEDILKTRKQSAQLLNKCKEMKKEIRKLITFNKNQNRP